MMMRAVREIEPSLTARLATPQPFCRKGNAMTAPQPITSKLCRKCGIVCPIVEFRYDLGPNGLPHSTCRSCNNARRRELRAMRPKVISPPPNRILPPDPFVHDPWSWTRVIFRPLPDWFGYGVDTLGNFWGCRKCRARGNGGGFDENIGDCWRMLAKPLDDDGYPIAHLHRDGRGRTIAVHRLVAAVFLGPRPDKAEVCHRDGTRDNNRVDNLRWGTSIENKADMIRHGTRARGSRNGNSRLTEFGVLEVRRLYAEGVSVRKIARRCGLSPSHASRIVKSESWKHVH